MKTLAVCSLLLTALAVAVNEPLALAATPVQTVVPCIRIAAAVEPDPANRLLTIAVGDATTHLNSEIPLNLPNTPRTVEVIFEEMPSGQYAISAVLIDRWGRHRAVVHKTVRVLAQAVE